MDSLSRAKELLREVPKYETHVTIGIYELQELISEIELYRNGLNKKLGKRRPKNSKQRTRKW